MKSHEISTKSPLINHNGLPQNSDFPRNRRENQPNQPPFFTEASPAAVGVITGYSSSDRATTSAETKAAPEGGATTLPRRHGGVEKIGNFMGI